MSSEIIIIVTNLNEHDIYRGHTVANEIAARIHMPFKPAASVTYSHATKLCENRKPRKNAFEKIIHCFVNKVAHMHFSHGCALKTGMRHCVYSDPTRFHFTDHLFAIATDYIA